MNPMLFRQKEKPTISGNQFLVSEFNYINESMRDVRLREFLSIKNLLRELFNDKISGISAFSITSTCQITAVESTFYILISRKIASRNSFMR